MKILVDGKYSQHLLLARGADEADYHVSLGPLAAGDHTLRIEADPALSAPQAGARRHREGGHRGDHPRRRRLRRAVDGAVIYARPDTVGKFTDLPVFMWYEIVPVPQGRQFRYSVIFTNEDGGTATDRLMATWGRTTDVEFVYGVTLNGQGKVVAEEFQGPGHEVPRVPRQARGGASAAVGLDRQQHGERVRADRGSLRAGAAAFDLTDVSREVVMDAHPWTYTLAAKEMVREKKLVEDAAAGSGRIPDPRRFVFVEACTELENAAVAFSVHAPDASGTARWFDADRGLPQFRIVRSGCFRGGVPLPAGAGKPDAIRFKAYTLPPRANAPPPAGPATVVLTQVNGVFTVADSYELRPLGLSWKGSVPLALNGEWHEVPIR